MSESEDAYRERSSAYEEADRIAHDLPEQLGRIRSQARLLRDRLFATRGPDEHLTARERAAATNDDD